MIARLTGRMVACWLVLRALRGSGAARTGEAKPDPPHYHRRGRTSALVAAAYFLLLFTYYGVTPHLALGALGVGYLAVSAVMAAPELLAVPFSRLTPTAMARVTTVYRRARAAALAIGVALIAIAYLPNPNGRGRLSPSHGLVVLGTAIVVDLVLVSFVVWLARRSIAAVVDEELDEMVDRIFDTGVIWLVAGTFFVLGTTLEFVAAR